METKIRITSHTVREGEGGMNWESSAETYVSPHKKQMATGNLLHDTEGSNLAPCDHLEGWNGVESQREVQDGGDTCIHGWFTLTYGRNQPNIIKQLVFN